MWWQLKLVVQVAVRYGRKTLEKHHHNNGHSAMLSFITHNCKVTVVASCDALHEGGIFFGWLQIGGTSHPFISLVLIGDAQSVHTFQRCTYAQHWELCICASQKSVHGFLGLLVLL
jgi:hypothetical protein